MTPSCHSQLLLPALNSHTQLLLLVPSSRPVPGSRTTAEPCKDVREQQEVEGMTPTALPLHFHDLQGHHIFPEGSNFLLLLFLFLVQELDVVDS